MVADFSRESESVACHRKNSKRRKWVQMFPFLLAVRCDLFRHLDEMRSLMVKRRSHAGRGLKMSTVCFL